MPNMVVTTIMMNSKSDRPTRQLNALTMRVDALRSRINVTRPQPRLTMTKHSNNTATMRSIKNILRDCSDQNGKIYAVNQFPVFSWRPPSPWFTLFCASVACACLALAYWQHRRVQLKQELQDLAAAQLTAAPLDLNTTTTLTAAELQWQPAVVVGSYAGAQLLLDNRIHAHRAGFHVITPLQLDDERWLLVNRGWFAAPAQREQAVAPAAPSGQVTITGLLTHDDSQAFELAADTGTANVWQQLHIERWNEQTGQTALPVVLLAQDPAEGLVAVAAAPNYRADVSRGYRLQWLLFACIAIGGWFAMALRRRDNQPQQP